MLRPGSGLSVVRVGLYRGNGKENGSYYILIEYILGLE